MTREPSPLRNLYISVACLLIVLVTGTAGYVFLEGWGFREAVYMTIITVASVGFREVRVLDPAGEWFTIGLILFGMGTLVYGITNLTAFVVEGDLQKLLRRNRMDKNLDKLKGHFILCGVGRIGKNIAQEILRMNYPLVVIDSNDTNLGGLEAEGYETFTILGDATEEKTLEKAGIMRAKGFISALPADSENLFVVITARQLNPSLRIIARVNEEENSQKMIRAGADKTVCPSHIGGLRMASELLRPAAVDFLDKMIREKNLSLRVEEAMVRDTSRICGKTFAEAQIPKQTGCVVVALRRVDGNFEFNPSADTLLQNGDALIIIGEIPKIALLKTLTGEIAG